MSNATDLKRRFLENAQDVVKQTEQVSINQEALTKLAQGLKTSGIKLPSWDDYVDPESLNSNAPIASILRLAQITAQNAGYIYQDGAGNVSKWEKDGSGAKALVGEFKKYFRGTSKADLFVGAPYRAERMEILDEMSGAGAIAKLAAIIGASQNQDGSHTFDMHAVEGLAKAFPKSYGDDPYRKKALLFFIMTAGHMNAAGGNVTLDIPAPADYRLPETLNAAGVIDIAPELVGRISAGEVFEEDDRLVTALRAATIEAVEKICEISGLNVAEVDFGLWNASRDGTLERLAAESRNDKPTQHLKCKTMWF